MRIKPPAVDYRKLRPGNLNSETFRHVKLLLFWPVFGLLFSFVERFYPVQQYYVMHCRLDDWIPFNEYFLIPYLFWFVFMIGTLLYTLFYDTQAFTKMMRFVIFTYSITMAVYLLFPTCQELRPESFERDNLLTRFVAGFYQFDTNTNVCPSIHVLGSFAAMFGGWSCRELQKPGWKIVYAVITVLICMSTVFLKQHSILDVLAALPLSAAGYVLCVRERRKGKACRKAREIYQ